MPLHHAVCLGHANVEPDRERTCGHGFGRPLLERFSLGWECARLELMTEVVSCNEYSGQHDPNWCDDTVTALCWNQQETNVG